MNRRAKECELFWIKVVLDDLKIMYERRMKLFCDNKSASALGIISFNMTRQNTLR